MRIINTYSTSQIAKIVGVHPNTVRMYEEWGLIQVPERKPNGYRVFTDIHIDQFHLAQKALKTVILQAGLRKKIIKVVKCSAKYQFDDAICSTKSYIEIAQKEKNNAIEATKIVPELFVIDDNTNCQQFKRAEVAKELDLTIDTIRNWEMNGLLKVKRRENGYRVYDSNDIKKLKVIRSLRCANYSLSAILRMLNAIDQNKEEINALELLNTSGEQDDIIEACDHLIVSLDEAIENAKEVLAILEHMKNTYQ